MNKETAYTHARAAAHKLNLNGKSLTKDDSKKLMLVASAEAGLDLSDACEIVDLLDALNGMNISAMRQKLDALLNGSGAASFEGASALLKELKLSNDDDEESEESEA